MNISEAKEQIKNAMLAYFSRDEYGSYVIPRESQRPVFLMGPPGIGKTAVMKQIAEELGVGLVSYSMTHHTRQSALGLPVITRKTYGGREHAVTEYTMSEIISSVYDMMEETGAKEGILFLDEINCVSETLIPTMLQFLQYKTFGRHAVPDGWIVVTAGNPPEYNRSAREFDVVTWDRLKRIDVEPDFSAWKAYSVKKGVHPAILTYLEAKKECFYRVEVTAEGRRFVTARGWSDLSDMMLLCEKLGVAVDGKLIGQYLQDPETAADFSVYYELHSKYRSDYKVGLILSGRAPEEIAARAKAAPFDERLSLLGLLLDSAGADMRRVMLTEDMLAALRDALREIKAGKAVDDTISDVKALREREDRRGALSPEKRAVYDGELDFLSAHARRGSGFEEMKSAFDAQVKQMRSDGAAAKAELEELFSFAERVWPEGQELLVLVSELTADYHAARFIARFGCEGYYRQSEALMFRQRQTEIIRRLEQLSDL